MQTGSPANLRRRNRTLVLRQIIDERALSRSQIARQTGLTAAAVSRIIRELIEVGLLKEGPTIELKGRVGRRNVALELDGGGAYVLGVAVAANARSVSLADGRGEIVARRDLDPLDLADPAKALNRIARSARGLVDAAPIDRSRLLGCGVSIAGRTDPETGLLLRSEPLGWHRVPVGARLSKALGMPVRVEGRAVALLLAELRRGVAVGKANVVLINNGLGFGGGIALDGRVARGHASAVGQIAHLAVGGDATPCACGRKGCLEAVASGAAVLRRLAEAGTDVAADVGDPGERLRRLAGLTGAEHGSVRRAFREAGAKTGHAVDALLSILDPELVLLAGVTGRQPDYLDGIRQTLARLRGARGAIPVRASEVTSEQSAIWLGLDAFVYSQDLDIDRLRAA